MPVDFTTRFKRLLREIISISSGIRDSALDCTNDQNVDISDRLLHQLETIRVSADAILQALVKATGARYSLDDQMTDWLASEEPHSCLSKLKEMNDILRPIDSDEYLAPSLTQAKGTLAKAMVFIDAHKTLFHFLLTPDVWNRERLGHLCSGDAAPVTNVVAAGNEDRPSTDVEQATVIDRKKELIHQKLNEISRWLTPMECMQRHRDTLRLRQEGTCKWFLDTNAYKTWRAPGNHFLWLHGKGGCGKSVLIAYTIERLKMGLEKEEVVAFFYCDFQNKRSTSSIELMRSLLSQLLGHIHDHGVDPGDFPDKILKQKSEGTLLLNNLEKLCDLVSRAASFFRYEPIIIIDALDECADIEALLPALVSLSQGQVRLLVTSRPDQTIVDHFTSLRSLSFEDVTDKIAADIALHITQELDLHNRLRSAISEMKDEIGAKLTGKAEGRFRWVQCQLDTLKRCTTRDELREALDSLPNELGATYERILGAIDERKLEGKLARRVLALLMVAIEPLQLAQIIDGLSMDFQKLKRDDRAQQWLETKLLHSLSSLVSYQEETDALALSHFSVKEYITSRSALPMYQIDTHEAHTEAAQICMGYISVFLKQKSSRGDCELWTYFPMLSYVLSSGFNHLSFVDSDSPVALDALQSLGADVRRHPTHWDRLCELREEVLEWPFAPWPSSKHDFLLYVLVAYSSPGLLRTFLSGNYPLRPRIRTNPLVYAADLRKTEHAIVLLAYGADVDARGLVIDDSHHASPLEVAIDLADDVLVEELLQRECSVTPELVATAICMPWCSTRVLATLMQTDEFADWALEIGEEKLYRSVFSSARPNSGDNMKTDEDHLILARRLRQFGLDLSAENCFGKELIERALRAAHTSMLEFLLPTDEPPPAELLIAASTGDTSETVPVVRFLLEKGVDVHAVSYQHQDTALHLAAMCPWEPRSLELTRLLIDAGCDPLALNLDGETPLVVAVRHGGCSVVDLLLLSNVPLPSNILHTALERLGNSQMVEFLLHRGADVHAVDSTGDTILHFAIIGPELNEGWDEDEDEDEDEENDSARSESECLDLVQHFLKAGCDATARNFAGITVLEMAMKYNFTSVVELLLRSDFPLPPDVLLIALQHNLSFKTIENLVQRGANVHSTTSDGDTVLHLALTWEDEEMSCKVMKMLISAGCDPTVCNSTGETALGIAIEQSFTSGVDVLFPPSVPLPLNALVVALWHNSSYEMIEYLVRRGADVHFTTSDGGTVLHRALAWEDGERCYKVMKKLITAGCDPTVYNSTGKTALELAMEHRFSSVVELLLSPDVPIPSNALLIALQHNLSYEKVEYLIQRGADVHSTTSSGDTVLHLTLVWKDEKMCCKVVEALINAGCDPTVHNSAGKTALELAMERRFSSVVKLLLSPDIPIPPNALLIALRHDSSYEKVEYLIQRGADVHSTTSSGDTVLHLTLIWKDEKMCRKVMEVLINAGCDPTVRNSAGKAPLEIAIERGFISVVGLLLSFDIPLSPNALLIAVWKYPTLEILEYLIQTGVEMCSTISNGDTVLHLALRWIYGEELCYKLVKRLIRTGCNMTTHGAAGQTALEIAMERNFTSVVKLLLSSNVPLPRDILLIAIRQESTLEVIEHLVYGGADVCSTTPDGDTALHLALATYHIEEECRKFVQCLIHAGCNPSACNSKGDTVLLVAIERHYASVVELLLSFDVTIPSDILHLMLACHCEPEIIQILICKLSTNDHLPRSVSSGSDWDALLRLASTSYPTQYRQQVTRILEDARKNCRTRSRIEAETYTHVAKRPRLDIWESSFEEWHDYGVFTGPSDDITYALVRESMRSLFSE